LQFCIQFQLEYYSMNFLALDFETSFAQHACSIGVVVVKDSKIIDKAHWYIKPNLDYFHPINISVHGITPNMVRKAPRFNELWLDQLGSYFEDSNFVFAHNVGFDIGVLKFNLDTYGLNYPKLLYSCTVKIARKQWSDLENHKLNTLAYHFGIQLKHHDALADAEMCANVALKAAKEVGAKSAFQLAMELGVKTEILGVNPIFVKKMRAVRAKKQ